MYLIGYDIGSSSVKASVIEAGTGRCIAAAHYPEEEMPITALKPGWAEQDPALWWTNLLLATAEVVKKVDSKKIMSVGISYQMHGLVMIDSNREVLRPSIIWCDSRAVPFGDKAFMDLGPEKCLSHLLNSPGNFTASKLKWVKENEPGLFSKVWKIMLPGDFIAMKLTGEVNTTIAGLSEGIFWDFRENAVAGFLLENYGFDPEVIPEIVPTFSVQGKITESVSTETGLPAGIPVSYRAGDQPNNAFSLNVLEPGEIAATAGTSGVVYGISDEVKYDSFSRVNTFAHVNHSAKKNRLGVLLCINGTGILYSWLRKTVAPGTDYDALNRMASSVPAGSEGVCILPFGNGAERMLGNADPGCSIHGLNFNIHDRVHLIRAGQEGIAFAFHYGMQIMKNMGIDPSVIRAGKANMFLSPVFRDTLAGISGANIELYNTDGAQGAARGAGIGSGKYATAAEAFKNLERIGTVEPGINRKDEYVNAYKNWLNYFESVPKKS